VGSRATTNLTPQVRPLELHPDPVVVELLDHDPRHLTSGVWFGDGWNAFPVRYPSFEEEGGVSGQGISDRFHRKRIAISINLIRLCAMGMRSPARAIRIGGLPGPLDASGVVGHGTRSRHDVVGRHTVRPAPSRFVISRFVAARSNLPTMMVRSASSVP
jgi:hypothetical protein